MPFRLVTAFLLWTCCWPLEWTGSVCDWPSHCEFVQEWVTTNATKQDGLLHGLIQSAWPYRSPVIILAPQDPGGKRKKPGGTSMEAPMASAGARAYNGGLGAVPPAGSRGRAPGQGVRGAKPPWSWKLFSFWTSNESDKICPLTSWNYPQPASRQENNYNGFWR